MNKAYVIEEFLGEKDGWCAVVNTTYFFTNNQRIVISAYIKKDEAQVDLEIMKSAMPMKEYRLKTIFLQGTTISKEQ